MVGDASSDGAEVGSYEGMTWSGVMAGTTGSVSARVLGTGGVEGSGTLTPRQTDSAMDELSMAVLSALA